MDVSVKQCHKYYHVGSLELNLCHCAKFTCILSTDCFLRMTYKQDKTTTLNKMSVQAHFAKIDVNCLKKLRTRNKGILRKILNATAEVVHVQWNFFMNGYLYLYAPS